MLLASAGHSGMTKGISGGFKGLFFLQIRFNSSFHVHGFKLVVMYQEVQVQILALLGILRYYVLCFCVPDMLEYNLEVRYG
jgi:hypothetical protein